MASALIYRIDKLVISLLKRQPVILLITVHGITRTRGFKNPKLIPVAYVNPPLDGIWDFMFEVEEPEGKISFATYEVNHFSTSLAWENFPESLRGIRVIGESNYAGSRLDATLQETPLIEGSAAFGV